MKGGSQKTDFYSLLERFEKRVNAIEQKAEIMDTVLSTRGGFYDTWHNRIQKNRDESATGSSLHNISREISNVLIGEKSKQEAREAAGVYDGVVSVNRDKGKYELTSIEKEALAYFSLLYDVMTGKKEHPRLENLLPNGAPMFGNIGRRVNHKGLSNYRFTEPEDRLHDVVEIYANAIHEYKGNEYVVYHAQKIAGLLALASVAEKHGDSELKAYIQQVLEIKEIQDVIKQAHIQGIVL